MRFELTACALPVAGGGGRAVWLTAGPRADDISATSLGLTVTASFAAHLVDRRSLGALGPRRTTRSIPTFSCCASGRRERMADMGHRSSREENGHEREQPEHGEAEPSRRGWGDGGPDGNAEDGRPAAADEILARLDVIDQRLEEKKGPPAGPTKAAFDKLAGSVAEIGENVKETRKLAEETAGSDPAYEAAVEAAAELSGKLGVYRADFGRWVEINHRIRRRWMAVAMAAGVPAALLLGLLVQHQFEAIPVHDPSGGWSGWVWETHGRAVVDCAVEARRTDAEVNCPLTVRRP